MVKKNIIKVLPAVILSSLLAVAIVYAWQDAPASPPTGQVPAPINVGSVAQTKQGGLNVLGRVNVGTETLGAKVNIYSPGTGGAGDVGLGQHFAISSYAPNIKLIDISTSTDDYFIHLNQGILKIGRDAETSIQNDLVLRSGNVGIGTTDPQARLDVGNAGSLLLSGHSTQSAFVELGQGRTGSGYAYIDFHGDTTYNDYALRLIRYNTGPNAESRIHHRGTGILRIYTQEPGSHIILQPGGNVGIGTVSPATLLQVGKSDSTTHQYLTIDAAAAYQSSISFRSAGTQRSVLYRPANSNDLRIWMQTGGDAVTFQQGGNVGIGITDPGSYKLRVNGNVAATAFYYTSDAGLKKNIEPLSDSLEKILKLQGVSFNWKDSDDPSIGFIAQEVEKIFPEAVSGSEGEKTIDYAKLIAPMIEAIKEQQKEIEALKAIIQ